MKLKTIIATVFLALLPNWVSAHCPLCTAGAGFLAVMAISLGVSPVIVSVLMGAFAWALGAWLSVFIKTEYVSYQKTLITFLIFIGTIIPLMPLVRVYSPLYVSLFGEYGGFFHRTYLMDLYLFGAVLGALIVIVAPVISRLITKWRGQTLPYQGLSITLMSLLLISILIQVLS